MTDENDDPDSVSDSAPRHLDPAGEIADAFESGDIAAELAADANRKELEEFVRKAEAGEFDLRADPGLEAAVRIVRALLAETDDES